MALSKIQAESMNLADTYAFTGTVSGAGKVLQVVHVESNSAISSTSTIPIDDTVPTSSEGVEILSQSFTPTSASSDLYFFCSIFCNEDINAGDNIALPLFKGTTFIGMGYHHTSSVHGANWFGPVTFTVKHSPASTSTQTYSLRGGVNNGTFESLATTTAIQNSRYGSNIKNTMTIMEVL